MRTMMMMMMRMRMMMMIGEIGSGQASAFEAPLWVMPLFDLWVRPCPMRPSPWMLALRLLLAC